MEDDISLRQAGQEGCPRGQVSFISMLTNMKESKMNNVAIIMFLAVFCCFRHSYLKLKVLCCNPVPGDLLSVRAGLITSRDPLGDGGSAETPRRDKLRREPICERQELAAVVNFNFGVSCGKRDSR